MNNEEKLNIDYMLLMKQESSGLLIIVKDPIVVNQDIRKKISLFHKWALDMKIEHSKSFTIF